MTFHRFLVIALGGFLGANARFFVGTFITISSFPVATLIVNTLGCSLLAIIYKNRTRLSIPYQDFLMTGFCGSFTTVSLFQFELFQSIQAGRLAFAISYLTLSLLLTLIPVSVILLQSKESGSR